MLAEQLFWLMKNMSDGVFVCGKRKRRRKGRGREEKKEFWEMHLKTLVILIVVII